MPKIDVPMERQFRMMSALHQELNPARRGKFVELLVDLLERQHVMNSIFLRPIKRAEFAVHVANVCVVDVSIDDVRHNIAPASAVAFRLCQIPTRVFFFKQKTAYEMIW